MSDGSRLTLRWAVAALVAILLVAAGAAVSHLLMRPTTLDAPMKPTSEGTAPDPTSTVTQVTSGAVLPDVTIVLTKDAVERAGIRTTPVRMGNTTASIRLPGVVEPNAYKQVVVTPVVAGRITR